MQDSENTPGWMPVSPVSTWQNFGTRKGELAFPGTTCVYTHSSPLKQLAPCSLSPSPPQIGSLSGSGIWYLFSISKTRTCDLMEDKFQFVNVLAYIF